MVFLPTHHHSSQVSRQFMLNNFVDYIVYGLIGLKPEAHLGAALNFFIYDSIKIFILLSVIIFLVAIIRSFFPPEKTRRILSRKREYIGNGLAGLLGIVTPFCSCSAVPLFISHGDDETSCRENARA